jgi:putative RNA 2'-phosphotransferase
VVEPHSERSWPEITLGRVLSHALRHEPWLYELELDADGWVAVAALREEREIPD